MPGDASLRRWACVPRWRNFYSCRILTIHVHANRRRQRDRSIVIRSVAGQHRMDVVPAQVLYNDLAACHAAARRRRPIGNESVVAIPGHHWGRFTCGNTSISLLVCYVSSLVKKKKKKIIPWYRRIATFRDWRRFPRSKCLMENWWFCSFDRIATTATREFNGASIEYHSRLHSKARW